MSNSFLSIKIQDLPVAQQSDITDNTDIIINDGINTKRTKISQILEHAKKKLGIGNASELKTQSKEVVSAINELNTNNITTVPLENSATGQLYVQKIGKIVYVSGDIALPDSYVTDASFRLGVLPYKPVRGFCFFTGFRGYSAVTGTPCRGHITLDGVIQVFCPPGSSGSVKFSAVFFTA